MAAKVDLHTGQGSRGGMGASGSSVGGQKQKMGDKKQGKGHLGVIEQGSSSEDAAFVLVEKKKLDNMQKKNKSAKKQRQQKKKNQDKQGKTCALCGKEGHFFRDCPDMAKIRKLIDEQGNA